MPMERLAMLAQIAGKQEQIIATQGLSNPLCGVPEYRNTLARMLETVSISDVSSYFKPLPPGWAPPAPTPPAPDPSLILAQVQGQKTAADIEDQRGEAQTKRAQLLSDDDRERAHAALQYYTQAMGIAAQHGTPLPSIQEFQQAMASKAPVVGLLPQGPLAPPPPTSPQQPATGQQAQPPRPPGPPQGGPQPMQQGMPGRAQQPLFPQSPMIAPPGNPAAAMGVQQGLQGRGMPTAYGQIANAAMSKALFGPGGPSMPKPAGQGVAGAPGA
jgi:hypothetical protein